MPLTSAEKKQNFIEKLKRSGLYEEYKKKTAEEAKKRRAKGKESLSKLTPAKRQQLICEIRTKCRKRVEQCRKRKKEQQLMDKRLQAESYRTDGAYRKAVAKTKRSLPAVSTKRNLVLQKVVNSLDPVDKAEVMGCGNVSKGEKNQGLTSDLIEAIQKFYEREDISRVSPNVKDCKRFVNDATGEKEYKQLRHLMYKLSEVHALFVEEYTEGQHSDEFKSPVQRSKFCSLRPKHVALVGDTPKEQCLCPYHSNFIQCWTAINKYLPEFPKYDKNATELLTCEDPTEECWFKTCAKCSIVNVNRKLQNFCKTKSVQRKPVVWQQWIKDEVANRTQNATVHGTVNDLMNHLIKIYPQFLIHTHIKKQQWEAFVADQIDVDLEQNLDHAVLHIDFAENFKCESQDEIQAAHFNQRQVSLLTTVMRHARKRYSKVIASDNTKHSKETLVAYLFKIFSLMPKTIKVVKIWSDGPSSQFKNKYIATVIKVFEQRFGKKIFWNYFATSHGKGAVDGVGAVVKKIVRTRIDSRKDIVNCTSDFVRSFKKAKSVIELIEVNDKEIEKINKTLKVVSIFDKAPTVKDIKSFHQLQYKCNKTVGFSMSKYGYNSLKTILPKNVKNPKGAKKNKK